MAQGNLTKREGRLHTAATSPRRHSRPGRYVRTEWPCARARPNGDYARLYAAAITRRQADQIYNLSLTRTATVTLARGAHTVIGVGRVKTRTLAIVCKREFPYETR